jgi:putative redox protein
MAKTNIVSASIGKEHYKTDLLYGDHSLIADEPLENGGASAGPSPSDLLASALASCTAITLRMYADRKEYDVEKIDVEITMSRTDLSGVTHTLFERKIRIIGNISEDERKRLLDIADKCPTHKVLKGEITITSTIE